MLHGGGEVRGGAGDEDAGCGVHKDNIAFGAAGAAEDFVGDGGVSKAIAAAQRVEGSAGETEVRWLPELLLHLAVFDLPDCG